MTLPSGNAPKAGPSHLTTADEVNKLSEGLAFKDHKDRVLQRTQTLNWDSATAAGFRCRYSVSGCRRRRQVQLLCSVPHLLVQTESWHRLKVNMCIQQDSLRHKQASTLKYQADSRAPDFPEVEVHSSPVINQGRSFILHMLSCHWLIKWLIISAYLWTCCGFIYLFLYSVSFSISWPTCARFVFVLGFFFLFFFISLLLLKIHLKEKKIKILIILSIMQVNILSSALTWISLFLKKKDLKQKLQERCVEKDPTGFLSNQGGGFKMWTD